MANICWIKGDLEEARKKYYTAKKLGEVSGCKGNYWPILINLVSFEVTCGDSVSAWEFHQCLYPHLQQICRDLTIGNLSFERKEYCEAALKIHLKNLWKLYQSTQIEDVFVEIDALWKESTFYHGGFYHADDLEKEISQLTLAGTIFDHNGLYLLKD